MPTGFSCACPAWVAWHASAHFVHHVMAWTHSLLWSHMASLGFRQVSLNLWFSCEFVQRILWKIFLCNSPCGIFWSWNTPTNFLKTEVLVPNLHLAGSKGFSGWVQNGELNLQSPWSGQVPINGSFVCGWSGWRDNDWSTQCSKWTGCGAFPGWEVSIRTWVRYLTCFYVCLVFFVSLWKAETGEETHNSQNHESEIVFPPNPLPVLICDLDELDWMGAELDTWTLWVSSRRHATSTEKKLCWDHPLKRLFIMIHGLANMLLK